MSKSSKQYRIEQQDRELAKLRQRCADLEARHDYLLKEMAETAQGLGIKPSWYNGTNTWADCMAHKAAMALVRVGKMALRSL